MVLSWGFMTEFYRLRRLSPCESALTSFLENVLGSASLQPDSHGYGDRAVVWHNKYRDILRNVSVYFRVSLRMMRLLYSAHFDSRWNMRLFNSLLWLIFLSIFLIPPGYWPLALGLLTTASVLLAKCSYGPTRAERFVCHVARRSVCWDPSLPFSGHSIPSQPILLSWRKTRYSVTMRLLTEERKPNRNLHQSAGLPVWFLHCS